ncbi:MAG: peptide-methionine (S)-S-oxide reductase MsrA [Gemmatimonadota bacterium]
MGGGCFWCLEAVFELLEGVERVESGYAGGSAPSPTYEEICAGTTGHAEVVQVTFDAAVVSYREILEVFFATHDPTTLNRQGPDVGTQYRSAIYYHSEDQKETAQDLIAELEREGVFPGSIVTEVAELTEFHPAEAYHQEYYRNNPNQPYCTFLIDPKVAKFRQQFADRLRAAPPGG